MPWLSDDKPSHLSVETPHGTVQLPRKRWRFLDASPVSSKRPREEGAAPPPPPPPNASAAMPRASSLEIDLKDPGTWATFLDWGAGVPIWRSSSVARTMIKGVCKCSGHCGTAGHKYWCGCSLELVVEGTNFCEACGCSVPGCAKERSARLRGKKSWGLCTAHGKACDALSLELRVTRAARSSILAMIPSDVPDFLRHSLTVRNQTDSMMVLLKVLLALIKEPVSYTHLTLPTKRIV